MLTVATYGIPTLLAILLAFGTAGLAWLYDRLAGHVRPEFRVAAIVLVIAIGALLSVALTSRTLDEDKLAQDMIGLTRDDLAGGFTASRWVSLVLVAVALVEAARGVAAAALDGRSDPAWPLLAAMLAYYLGTVLIQAVASDEPGFSARALYVPVVLTAVFFQRPATLAPMISAARWSALALMLGSLAALRIAPDFVMHRPDPGWIPGLDWRLFGLAEHANALAPIALLALLIELHAPSPVIAVRWACRGAAFAVFVLAQSKTTWGSVPLMLVFVQVPLALKRAAAGADPARNFARMVWTLSGTIVAVVVLATALVAFDAIGFLGQRADIVTLTGRTKIWDITLQAWRDNVLFGYGPEIWGPERQRQFRMFYVGHAHNQVVQALGEAGLVGLALLLAYLGALLLAALRCFSASRGLVLMLLMLVLVPCITEAPMRGNGLLSWSTFVQVLLMATAAWHVRQRAAGIARATAPGDAQDGSRTPPRTTRRPA